MIVAELFARLGIRQDKKSFRDARNKMGQFVKGSQKQMDGLGKGIRRIGTAIAGVFAARSLFTAGKDALSFNEEITRLGIASAGKIKDLKGFTDKVLDVSNSTGVAKEDVLGATRAFISLTGDTDAATQSMELFAKINKGTGTEMNDIAAVAARLSQNLEILPDQFEKSFSILIRSGKAGAVEMKEMAGLFGSLTALSKRFQGAKGVEGLASLSGALQLVMQGAGSAAQAGTQLEGLLVAIGTKKTSKELRSKGIEVFNKDGSLKTFETIIAAIKKKNFRSDVLGEIFGRKEAVLAFESITKVEGAWKGLKDESLLANDASEDYLTFQKSASARVAKAWNKFKNAVAKVFIFVIEILEKVAEHTELVAIGIMSIVTALAILKARMIVTAIAAAASWVLALIPFIILAAGIAAIILLIGDLKAFLDGDESWIDWGKGIEDVLRKIGSALESVRQKAINLVEREIAEVLEPGQGGRERVRKKQATIAFKKRADENIKRGAEGRKRFATKQAATEKKAFTDQERRQLARVRLSEIRTTRKKLSKQRFRKDIIPGLSVSLPATGDETEELRNLTEEKTRIEKALSGGSSIPLFAPKGRGQNIATIINVTAPAGADAAEYARLINEAWDKRMRDVSADTEN